MRSRGGLGQKHRTDRDGDLRDVTNLMTAARAALLTTISA
jgi:hypothetical protein